MKATKNEIEKILDLLDETPRRIVALTANLSEDRLHYSPNKATWSAAETLAHLRACADVWESAIQSMLAKDNPSLSEIHPNDWMKEAGYETLRFAKSLKAYLQQRKNLLLALRGLLFDDWERGASIKGHKHTVFSTARRMALHEADHIEQIRFMLK